MLNHHFNLHLFLQVKAGHLMELKHRRSSLDLLLTHKSLLQRILLQSIVYRYNLPEKANTAIAHVSQVRSPDFPPDFPRSFVDVLCPHDEETSVLFVVFFELHGVGLVLGAHNITEVGFYSALDLVLTFLYYVKPI